MSILQKMKKDNLKARKEKDQVRVGILTLAISEIEKVGKDNGNRETTDDEAVGVLRKMKKSLEETYVLMEKGGNTPMGEMDKVKKESSIVSEYLPQLMSREDLEILIKDIVAHDSNINLGKVMKFLSSQYKGKYDGKMASEIARKILT